MSTPSFDDLTTVPDQDTALNVEVLPELKTRAVRVTDWLTGGVYLAMAYVVAKLRTSVRQAIATLVAAGFEDYVFGFATLPAMPDGSIIDVTSWAPFVAKQRYGVTQLAATYTLRNITLTNSINSAYGPIADGDFMIKFPSGNRYVNVGSFTIPASGAGGVVVQQFRSEFTTDSSAGLVYNDASNSTIELVTSQYTGVSATNPSTDFSAVTQSGSSAGAVAASGSPSGNHNVAVRIDTTGSVAGATVGWSTQVDSLGWVQQTGSSATNLGGFGINVTLSDNSGGDNAFAAGSYYYFNTPGSDITSVGGDAETPQALGTRCRGMWPSLAFAKDSAGNFIPASPTKSAYEVLARSFNDQVRVVLISRDTTVNNKVNIIIAGQGGTPLSGATVANGQTFFDAYSMLTDYPVVNTSTARAITLAGLTVTAKANQLAAAQAALTLRLQTYLGGVDAFAPFSINGLIDYDYIISLVRTTPGVTKVSGTLTINGGSTDLQLPVTAGAFESASWSQTAATAFTWAAGG